MIQEMSIAAKEACDIIATFVCIASWLPGIEAFLAIIASVCTIIWFGLRFWEKFQSKK